MNSIILGVNVVTPLMVYIILGYSIKALGWIKDETITEMNSIVFKIFLSMLIFLNSYGVDFETVFVKENMQLIILSVTTVLLTIGVSELICRKNKIEKARKAIIVQGVYRSDLALFALAISTAIYGEGNQEAISIIMAVLVPLYNVIAVTLLANGKEEGKVGLSKIVPSVTKNPLVIASVLGLTLSFLNIELQSLTMGILYDLSKVATPLSFILLGASLVFDNMLKNKKAIILTSIGKLVIVPLFVIIVAVTLGIRGQELVALFACFASPVAVASYTMAKNEDVEPELASEIVAFTTLGSIFTIFIFIVSLNYLSLI